jgi:hypothetical protein
LSFFEEGEEPRTAIATERAPRRRPRVGGRTPRRPTDERTVFARRAGAIAALIVVVAVVVFGVRAYLTSEQSQALKNYNSNVTTLLEGEQTQVAQAFFSQLNGVAGISGQALEAAEAAIYQDAVTARLDAQTAAGWSVPGSLADAQRDLLLALDLRYEAIDKVSSTLTTAINGPDRDGAIEDIAGDMGMIYASDVLYQVRVAPLIEQALSSGGVQVAGTGAGGVSLGGVAVYDGTFLPNQSWTTAGYVAGKVLGYTPPALGGTIESGPHGHSLTAVLAGSTALDPGVINHITYTKGLTFTIDFTNDGANDEFDVETQIVLSSAQTTPLTATASVRETQPGGTYAPTLGFTQTPPLNTPLKLTATVLPVPGEEDRANNSQSYYVEFNK